MAAAGCALFSLVSALTVSVRANQAYNVGSAKEGFHIVRYAACWLVLAEMAIYASFIFFLSSVHLYMNMMYAGPDICALKHSVLRENSFCSRLGVDMHEVAEGSCQNITSSGPPPPLEAAV